MALVVGEDTYATVTEADTYNSKRNRADWALLSDSIKEQWLTIALDKIESCSYMSTRYSVDQELEFPRKFTFSWDVAGEIPIKVKEAQIEEAYSIFTASSNGNSNEDIEKGIESKSMKDNSVKYSSEVVKQNFNKSILNYKTKNKLSKFFRKNSIIV